jgi:hypothetical protein
MIKRYEKINDINNSNQEGVTFMVGMGPVCRTSLGRTY